MLAISSGVEFWRALKVQAKKVVILCSSPAQNVKWRKFQIVVVQQRQRNVKKAWPTCKVIVLDIVAVAFAVVGAKAPYWPNFYESLRRINGLDINSVFRRSLAPNSPSTRQGTLGIRVEEENHSGKWFQKDAVSVSRFTGFVWTEGRFVNKNKMCRFKNILAWMDGAIS